MISILSSECWECKNLIHFSILLPGDTVPQYNTDTIISIFRYFGLTFQILMEFLETKYETLHHFDCLANLFLVVGGGVDCCSGVLTGVSVYYWLICIYLLILCPLGTSGCDASTRKMARVWNKVRNSQKCECAPRYMPRFSVFLPKSHASLAKPGIQGLLLHSIL